MQARWLMVTAVQGKGLGSRRKRWWREEGRTEEERWVAGPRWAPSFRGTGPHRVRELLLAWVLWEPPTSAGILGAKGGTTQISETDTRWSQAESGEVRPKDRSQSLKAKRQVLSVTQDDVINHLPELTTNRISDVYPILLLCRSNLNFSER